MRNALKTFKKAALLMAALVLTLMYVVSSSYGADKKADEKSQGTSGSESKSSPETANKPVQQQPKSGSSTPTPGAVQNNDLKNLPYAGTGKKTW